jgi:TetR/AcrR family transcriptional repressor of nem operon
MTVRGVGATTLEDVRVASGTSKSQLYHHFADKDALVRDVIAWQGEQLLARQEQRLRRLRSMRGLELWRDAMLQRNRLRQGAYGCALGSLANELADQNEDARVALAALFARWEQLLADGLERMREDGTLRPDADPAQLATGLMAALQGGYLLAQTAHDSRPMEIALDMALDHVRSHLLEPDGHGA